MRQPEENNDAAVPTSPKGLLGRIGNWLFSHHHFHLKLISGTALGVLVIVFLAGTFFYVTLRHHMQELLRSHTVEVIRLSSLVENDIGGLETGHRGYLLTGDRNYVSSFDRRREEISRRLQDLQKLTDKNERQATRLTKVEGVINDWITNVALPEINAADRGLTNAAIDPATGKSGISLGNKLLDQAREALQSLQDEEQIVLNQRMAEEEW